jgi:hypothetical protein
MPLLLRALPALSINLMLRCSRRKTSSSGQGVLYRLSPLTARDIIIGDFAGPCKRQVARRPEKEDEALTRISVFHLTVEFECLFPGVSTNIEHYEIVDMRLPEKSRSRNLFGDMYLDSVTSQNGSAYLAGSLAGVNEKNFLFTKNRAVRHWRWAIHSTLPKRARPLWEEDSAKVCAEKGLAST